MIVRYKKGNKIYNFYEPKRNNHQNIYTVIVGKNGSGKSRLLNEVIEYFRLERDLFNTNDLEFLSIPKKIIAVSTSPYDKFPIINDQRKYDYEYKNYSYVGIRDLKTSNFSLGFMSKIINQLLNIRNNDSKQFSKIIQVLNYLEYSEDIHLVFEIRLLNNQIKRLFEADVLEHEFMEILSKTGFYKPNFSFFKDAESDELNKVRIDKLLKILHSYNFGGRKRIYEAVVNSSSTDSEIEINDLIFLMDSGLAKLRDVGLKKLKSNKIHQISDASSGQQCIFTTLVGIACNISDNSLILIDEPEISLHPEWQEKYITLLIETFQNYKNCHFIIATHSPQLISKLSTENCYILQMDNQELMNANEYANNSIDFQLANIFNSPGFKNEYLSRISFSIISKVGKTKKFDEEDVKNYNVLKSQIKFLHKNDPIISLFNLIKELKK
ncbi:MULTISPECIES: ATP-binding protein [unclassified Chryseobacterium]|uniref:ATP-binding protein n=1 Tax=unclassified Chryseobacterium TaxID=2593645 RepID=UPI002269BEFC|nr:MULTISPECIES: ATP-binding protein [unclassified Chryseobacterium]